jgi:hypothetical protein
MVDRQRSQTAATSIAKADCNQEFLIQAKPVRGGGVQDFMTWNWFG